MSGSLDCSRILSDKQSIYEPRHDKTLPLRVYDQVRHKLGCTATEEGWRLEISALRRRGIVLHTYVAKTKALISYTITMQLICAFVFTYAKSRFSHDVAPN